MSVPAQYQKKLSIMNRYLSFAALAAAMATAFNSAEASVARMSTPANHQLISTSRNDKWGVGYIGDGAVGDIYGFRWNLVTGKIENVGTLNDAGGIAVDNNGVVYGVFKTLNNAGAEISIPGYYKEGVLHPMTLPEGFSGDGLDACCSADGKFVGMTLTDPTGHLVPVVWREGVPFVVSTNGDHSRVSCITEDGSMIGGWMNTSNRQSTLWTFDGTGYNNYKHPGSTPKWTDNVMGFSADNRYALVDDGWNYETGDQYYGYYDIENEKMLPIDCPDDRGAAIYMYNMSDDKYAIGSYEGTAMIVNPDRKASLLIDWLKENYNVDAHDFPEIITYENVFRLERGMTVNHGAKRIGFLYYGEYPGVEDYYPFYSMYLVLDADAENATPLELKATKLPGIASVNLEWDIPFACERKILGYEVYRDGKKINSELVTEKHYYDRTVSAGTHQYAVRTVFEGGLSDLSDVLDFEMDEAFTVNPPHSLAGRQQGFNRVNLDWEAPAFNSGNLSYFDLESSTDGIGTAMGDITMEIAVMFPAEQMDLYRNASLKSVSFTPLSDCDKWKLCLYNTTASGALREIYSQEITQQIKTGEANNIILDTPYVCDGKALIVGIQAYSKEPNVRLFGFQEGKCQPGFSDLLRNVDGSNLPFDSFYNLSEQVYTSPMSISWKISANLVPEGMSDDIDKIDSYTVYADGTVAGSTTDTGIILSDLTDGDHTFAVVANYATGAASKPAQLSLNVDLKSNLKPVDAPTWKLNGETKELTVTWETPADDDRTLVTYANGSVNRNFVPTIADANEMYAGALYPANSYKTYKDYEIRSVSFVPASSADFSYELVKDGEVIASGDVENYELGKWNDIKLPEPIAFDPLSDYELHFNAYDFEEGKGPFFMSDDRLVTGKGDLISLDGEEWNTVLGLAGQAYNWMLRMEIAETGDTKPMPVEGYDVAVDSKAVNKNRISDNTYTFVPEKSGSFALSVDAYYPGVGTAVKGTDVIIDLTSGVGEISTQEVSIRGGKGCIYIIGEDVTDVEVIDLQGNVVAHGAANNAVIDGIASGIYVVRAKVDGKPSEVAKITVK